MGKIPCTKWRKMLNKTLHSPRKRENKAVTLELEEQVVHRVKASERSRRPKRWRNFFGA